MKTIKKVLSSICVIYQTQMARRVTEQNCDAAPNSTRWCHRGVKLAQVHVFNIWAREVLISKKLDLRRSSNGQWRCDIAREVLISHELSQDKERRLSKLFETRELVLCKYTLQPLELVGWGIWSLLEDGCKMRGIPLFIGQRSSFEHSRINMERYLAYNVLACS